MVRTGQRYKQKGFSPNHPIVIIPGLCSSAMKVVESPHKDWIDRRIWLDITTIGFGKVWDQMSIMKKKKKKKTETTLSTVEHFTASTNEIESAAAVAQNKEEEDQNRRRWIAHMVLQKDGMTDPPGIKLRPIETIHGIMYLDPGAITNALSYVFGPLVETLWDIGYTDKNLRAAPYDWRIPPGFLEFRDGYFTKLKEKVDDMYEVNDNKKVVIVAHSLGTRCTNYFLRFCEKNWGREWISERIHTWIAVGPLFLGAPKSVRATTSGERMGLDAFLFEDEGILLSRGCGSSGWMFPYIVPDYEFTGYVYQNRGGQWKSQTLKETLCESDVEHIWKAYVGNYINDPCFGPQEEQLAPPPIDKILAIYGINLKTEIFYFYKPSNGLTKLELDPTGEMDNFVCSGGIAYETKNTSQNKLRGKKRGGDGTVPYASLSYCTHWKKQIDVTVEELEGAEHREILKDKSFTRIIVEYNCHAPPPPQLPNTFKNLVYDIREIRDQRQATRRMTLTHKGIQVQNKSNNTIYHKKYSAVKNIIEHSDNTFTIEYSKSSTIHAYRSEKFREIIQELNVRIKFIEYSRPSAEEAIDEQGQTELHRAVKDGDIASVRELLSDDRNVNAQDNHGWTPLHIATHKNDNDIALLLLRHPKIDVNLKTKDATLALTYALRNVTDNNEEVWNAFVASGADVNGRGTDDCTPLHEATMRMNIKAVKWLIKEFANVNAKNIRGETPLHYAVQHNDKDLIALLLEHGADRHLQTVDKKTPLNYAQRISTDLMTFLRDYKVSGYRVRAMFAYSATCKEELSFEFGDRINNVKITSDYGDGWWFGECNGNSGYFPSNYVKVSEQIRDASRPSLGAPEPEDGPNDTRDEYGQTPLHKACFEDRCDEVFSILMDKTTNVNAQDRNGWTPSHCAASQGSLEVLLVLLQNPRLDLTIRNTDGTTALHYVARLKPENEDAKKKLSQILDGFLASVDIDILGKSGETPLHQAVLRSSVFVVKYLLEHDADPNALNDSNAGPLFYAVSNRDIECVKLLLVCGADPTIKSKRGTPMEHAVKTNSSSILQLLEDHKPTHTKDIVHATQPTLPSRKNSVRYKTTGRQLLKRSLRTYATEEDLDLSSNLPSDDDFESVTEESTDTRTQALSRMLTEEFGNDMQAFETCVFKFILEKGYNGDGLAMRNSVTAITRGKTILPTSGSPSPGRPSFIGNRKSSSLPQVQDLPQTATETADSLLTNRRKKANFFGKRSS